VGFGYSKIDASGFSASQKKKRGQTPMSDNEPKIQYREEEKD
jgi:hypothetical protein